MIKVVVFDAYGTLYDVYSVVQKCEGVYPGNSQQISQIWRQKQLEYSWLRSLMDCYEDFWTITQDALRYALDEIGLGYNQETIAEILEAYLHLHPYPEVIEALEDFRPHKLAILSNGNPKMLQELSVNTGLNKYLDHILSADSVKIYQPRSEVYQLVIDHFDVSKKEILFVSSNGWDATGAKSFGFKVGWINRLNKPVEKLGYEPDYTVSNLKELALQTKDR